MFTQNWSQHLPAALEKAFPTSAATPMTCVEVGSFEGKGSLAIVAHLCQHPESRLFCIDPWEDVYVPNRSEFQEIDHKFVGQYQRFLKNTEAEPKITAMRGTSDEKIQELADASVDFAYIDGDHSPDQVYKDGVSMHHKLKAGATLIFDDYGWVRAGLRCADGIDRFIEEYAAAYELVSKGWHVILKKKTATL
jgi:predicted O-methyltransferase YrrM